MVCISPASTGASSGIGAASAIKFAKHGCRLVVCGRNVRSLNDVADKCVAEGIPRHNVRQTGKWK